MSEAAAVRLVVAAAEAQAAAQRRRMQYDAASGLYYDAPRGWAVAVGKEGHCARHCFIQLQNYNRKVRVETDERTVAVADSMIAVAVMKEGHCARHCFIRSE